MSTTNSTPSRPNNIPIRCSPLISSPINLRPFSGNQRAAIVTTEKVLGAGEGSHSLGLLVELFTNLERDVLSSTLTKHNYDVISTIEECLDYTESRDNFSPSHVISTPSPPPPTFTQDTSLPTKICPPPPPPPAPASMGDFSINNIMTNTRPKKVSSDHSDSERDTAPPAPLTTNTSPSNGGSGGVPPPSSKNSTASGAPVVSRLMWPFSDAALLRTLVTCNSCNSIIQLGDKFCRICGVPALPFIL
eukprot:sb/3468863/